ncbi:unnamed protein product [Dicrocoelium dendriticum]|nr:unnamed protein product [Dicrocoelium dendriticum]
MMRLRGWYRCFTSTPRLAAGGLNYVLLDSKIHKRLSYMQPQRWIGCLLFILGLPSSILLLHTDPPLAVCLSAPVLILLVTFSFHMLENSLVYAREEPAHSRLWCDSPEDHGFQVWESVNIYPDGNGGPKVTGFLLFNEDATARTICPTIYLLHGNAGNIGHRLPLCRLLADHVHCNLFLIDYRGYGRSSGIPSEPGLYADAQAGLDYLLSRLDIASDRIFVFGRSIGGAVAIHLSTCEKNSSIRGVIIENSFTSLPSVARHIFGATCGLLRDFLPSWIFVNKYPSYDRLKTYIANCQDLHPRFLFISGDVDEVIPSEMMKKLSVVYAHSETSTSTFQNAVTPAEFLSSRKDGLVVFSGGKHNTTWLCPNWAAVISHFIQQTCAYYSSAKSNAAIV